MKRVFVSLLLAGITSMLLAANTTTTVSQVTTTVNLEEDVDYVITSTTPFTDGGVVNFINTEHAVLIIQNIKPSVVISDWLGKHVQINGAKAVNKTNCQVRMYAHGAIVFPYDRNFKPLTVYAEKNLTGTSCNSFGLEHSGGFMNTLTEAKLNNQIRSFTLKRGYMVTFSTRKEGRGYSRCFIADKEDLEVKSLPMVLDQKITSYRVFQWFNAPKKGLGSDTRENANSLINSSWCYDWGTGHDMTPDVECVPNHIYEDYPSPAACGNVTYSCHMKTNNEPGNSADDHPQDVATVLANWENLMRTGLRLCSESSHDGSMAHLKAFIDSIDARGWRCDILDLHCYWASGSFNSLTWYSDYYGNGRPIWISEWVWGASWNNNGAFNVKNRDDFEGNFANCYNGTKPILEVINANSRVERYAYWNSEANCSKLFNGDMKLSTIGDYYKDMTPGLGYNAANEFIPKNPRQYNLGDLSIEFDKNTRNVTLHWHENNGEYNRLMEIQQQKTGSSSWTKCKEVVQKEEPDDYTEVFEGVDGYRYRIHIKDLNGKDRYTNEVTALSESLEYGDIITVGKETKYLGGNLLINGSFDFGMQDWTNGKGEAIAAPYFEVLPKGGFKGSYLQCYGNSTDIKGVSSLRKLVQLERGGYYYVSVAGCNNNPETQCITTTNWEDLELNQRASLPVSKEWCMDGSSFHVTSDTILMIQMRNLGGVAQFDEFKVCRLFSTKDSALNDALYWCKLKAQAFIQYNKTLPWLNSELDGLLSTDISALALEEAVQTALQALDAQSVLDSLQSDAQMVVDMQLTGYEQVAQLLSERKECTSAKDLVRIADALAKVVQGSFDYTLYSGLKNSNFVSSDGWNVKAGTYKSGDQRTAGQAGKSCWNAWWSIAAAGNQNQTMSVNQTVEKLPHGLYALECLATTQHYCVTDQHAYLESSRETVNSTIIPFGNLDIASFSDDEKWHALVTPYLYINEGESLTLGFTGSKKGAVDNSWMSLGSETGKGDNREGWWCATDFALRSIPMYRRQADAAGWGTICLPKSFTIPTGVTLYKVAGILTSHAGICLEPYAAEPVAGGLYVFKTEPNAYVNFFENGASVKNPETSRKGVMGYFTTTMKYNANALILQDGEWRVADSSMTSTVVEPFSCYIALYNRLDNYDEWTGVTLPTAGIEVSIEQVNAETATQEASLYNLNGQRTISTHGLIVRQGKVVFVR